MKATFLQTLSGRATSGISGCCNRRLFWGLSKPTNLVEKRRLAVPIETLFDVVLDVDRYKLFLPFCTESKVIKRLSSNSFEADLSIGFESFHASYTSVVDFQKEVPPWTIQATAKNSTLFSTMNSGWGFKPVSGGRYTDIEFEITFEVGPSSVLLGPVVRSVLKDVAARQVAAFEQRCREVVAKQRARPPQRGGPSPVTGRIFDR